MSYNDLMDAFKRGRISRRSFIRGMAAVGVSAVVAERLANQVEAAPVVKSTGRTARMQDDVYGGTDGTEEDPTLPATGSGTSSSSALSVKFLAIGGAAAAAGAAVLRKVKTGEESA